MRALVTSALRMMKVSPCVGGCHVRGSPLLPPGRSVPGGVARPEAPSSACPIRALGTWGLPLAPAGEHPEVPHQCPRMGLGVDEDGPPLS